ncbi:MAG: hypothetical protein F6J87_16960 [Spirulina sp. SIO3F2]|nr:hypothetical protein [Spirulina sp. SIO3F2]
MPRSNLSDWVNHAILEGMTLEQEARPPSVQSWLGLLYLPEPPPKSPEPRPRKSRRPKRRQRQSTQPGLPWRVLSVLALSYLPIGIILGLGTAPNLTWALAAAGAWVWLWSLVLAWAGSWSATLA